MYKTACPDRYDILKELAKENRNHPTLAESLLWKYLKRKSLGVKFLRQHPVLDFIPDFICIEKGLIVEVDGGYHAIRSQIEEDETRTKRLSDMGYKVIRFTNEEVLHDIDSVINKIKKEIAPLLRKGNIPDGSPPLHRGSEERVRYELQIFR